MNIPWNLLSILLGLLDHLLRLSHFVHLCCLSSNKVFCRIAKCHRNSECRVGILLAQGYKICKIKEHSPLYMREALVQSTMKSTQRCRRQIQQTQRNILLDKLEAELSFNKKRLLTGLFNLMW